MNAFNMLMYILLIMLGGISGYFYKLLQKPTKRVDQLRSRDHRGKTHKVVDETDIGLICKKSGGIIHRFIKRGPGWTFSIGGRMVTRFFGMEGTAYTALIEDGPITTKVSLLDHLKLLWGDKFKTIYNALPNPQRQAIETDVIGVTVEVVKIDEQKEKLPLLSSADVYDEDDNIVLTRIAKTPKSGTRTIGKTIYELGGAMVIGALLMYFLMTRGVV